MLIDPHKGDMVTPANGYGELVLGFRGKRRGEKRIGTVVSEPQGRGIVLVVWGGNHPTSIHSIALNLLDPVIMDSNIASAAAHGKYAE